MKSIGDDWFAVGELYFRFLNLFQMPWGMGFSFAKFKIAVGECSGHIALLSEYQPGCKPVLQIYTASGKLVTQQLWKDAPPLTVEWSGSEDLLVVQKNGFVAILDLSGNYIRRFSLGPEAEERGICDARTFTTHENTGIAVLTGGNHIYITNSIDTPRIMRLADLSGVTQPITQWEIVTGMLDLGAATASSTVDRFRGPWAIVCRKRTISRTDFNAVEAVDIPFLNQLEFDQIRLLAVTRSSKFVALYLDNGTLIITNTAMSELHCSLDLTERISVMLPSSEHPIRKANHPLTMLWITESAVVLQWDKLIALVGTNGDLYECFIPEDMCLLKEVDSVRILTPTAHKLLQRVPSALETIGRIGASCAATWLVSASLCLKAASARTNDYLLPITNSRQMIEAISHCLKAATHANLDAKCQQLLLEAAHMGRLFLTAMFTEPGDRPTDEELTQLGDRAANICRTLRLLNNLATPWIGLALTWTQFQKIGPKRLFERLLARNHYPMAVEFVCHMPVNEDSSNATSEPICTAAAERYGLTRVLAHWACHSAAAGSEDPSVIAANLDRIVTALRPRTVFTIDAISDNKAPKSPSVCTVLDFADVASQALAANREKIAEQLLEYEVRTWQQVPLLLKLGRYNRALALAVKSGDPDLITMVIAALKDQAKLPSTDLMMALRRYPMALAVYQETWGVSSCESDTNQDLSRQTVVEFDHDERTVEAKKHLISALRESNLQLRLTALRRAEDSYKQAKNEFMIQECNATSRLLQFQSKLEKQEFRAPVFDTLSAADINPSAFPLLTSSSRLIVPSPKAMASETEWLGQPLSITLLRLLSTPQGDRLANQLRREFHVSDKRFAYLRLLGLAVQNDCLAEVEKLAKTKKPLVSLEIIIKVCIDCNLFEEALKLVPRLPMERRVRILTLCGQIEEAINLAVQEKSDRDLVLILEHVGPSNRALCDRITTLRQQIR